MSTTVNLALVPSLPSVGLYCRILQPDGAWLDLGERLVIAQELSDDGLVVERLAYGGAIVQTFTLTRAEAEIDMDHRLNRQRALRHMFDVLVETVMDLFRRPFAIFRS